MSEPLGGPGEETGERAARRARWEAAEVLTWGGLGPVPNSSPSAPPARAPLPEGWTDVTDVVLAALARVRAEEDARRKPPQ